MAEREVKGRVSGTDAIYSTFPRHTEKHTHKLFVLRHVNKYRQQYSDLTVVKKKQKKKTNKRVTIFTYQCTGDASTDKRETRTRGKRQGDWVSMCLGMFAAHPGKHISQSKGTSI